MCTFLVFDVSLCLGVCFHCWGFVSSGAGVGTGGGATAATGPETVSGDQHRFTLCDSGLVLVMEEVLLLLRVLKQSLGTTLCVSVRGITYQSLVDVNRFMCDHYGFRLPPSCLCCGNCQNKTVSRCDVY